MCEACGYPDHFEENMSKKSAKTLATIAPNLYRMNERGDLLRSIVEDAKAYWDGIKKPYPKHLQSLIVFMEGEEDDGCPRL